jgi:hypothetical protein
MAEFFRVHTIDSAQVIELFLPDTIDPLEFDRLNDAIQTLLDTNSDGRLGVGCWTGTRDVHGQRDARAAGEHAAPDQEGGGRLVLCGLSPRLMEIFRTCCMERLFTITRARAEAVKTHRGAGVAGGRRRLSPSSGAFSVAPRARPILFLLRRAADSSVVQFEILLTPP